MNVPMFQFLEFSKKDRNCSAVSIYVPRLFFLIQLFAFLLLVVFGILIVPTLYQKIWMILTVLINIVVLLFLFFVNNAIIISFDDKENMIELRGELLHSCETSIFVETSHGRKTGVQYSKFYIRNSKTSGMKQFLFVSEYYKSPNVIEEFCSASVIDVFIEEITVD